MSAHPVTLRDGRRILVRPIEPGDRDAVVTAFDRLSPESRYRRFFRPVDELSDRQLDYLTSIDHKDHEALIALDEHGARLVGVGRYVRTGPRVAEPAMVVADDWQGQGVATVLLERLVNRAREEGIERFSAPVLASNPAAIRLLEQAGDAAIEHQGSVVDVDIRLRTRDTAVEPASPLRTLLRAMAAGAVDPALSFWQRLLPHPGGADDDEHRNLIVAAVEPTDQPTWHLPAVASVACDLAAAWGASVVLVATRGVADDGAPQQQRLRRIEECLKADGTAVSTELRVGDLGAAALDVAAMQRARLIVVDDATADDACPRLVGSTSDYLFRRARCSTLFARGTGSTRLLVDLTPTSEARSSGG